MTKQRFAVVGNPALHSKSPQIFNAAFKKIGVEACYTRILARSTNEAVSLFKDLNLSGFNVTAPFKEEIIPLLDEIDPIAEKIGSVNTVVCKNGKLIGHNTDYLGVINSLPDLKNKKALLLGAGGAAKAACFGLVKEGAEVTVINRTYKKAVQLAKQYGCVAKPIEEIQQQLEIADIIVNTLPAGVKIIENQSFIKQFVFLDANYSNSAYQKLAENQNVLFISGENWLLNQAFPAFEIFIGKKFTKHPVVYKNESLKTEKIALIGFMGAGKSSVGKLLAEKMKYDFLDTDEIIQKRAGKNISGIFEEDGEQAFREMEEQAIKEIHEQQKGNVVIACGGGMLEREANREMLEDCTSIFLHVNENIALDRIGNTNRPLLSKYSNVTKLKELLNVRLINYLESADLVINACNENMKEIADRIYEEINKTR